MVDDGIPIYELWIVVVKIAACRILKGALLQGFLFLGHALLFQGAAIPVLPKKRRWQVLYQLPIFPVSVDSSGLQDMAGQRAKNDNSYTEVCRYMTFDPLRKNHMWHCLVFFLHVIYNWSAGKKCNELVFPHLGASFALVWH